MTFSPTTELVAVGWIKLIPGVPATVATTLPGPNSSGVVPWSETGAVTCLAVGGSRGLYLHTRSPVVTIDCWGAPAAGSTKPPFGLANSIAETIIGHTYTDGGREEVNVTLAGYHDARVLSAYSLTEPRRIPEEDTAFAHYTFDLQLHWIEVPAP